MVCTSAEVVVYQPIVRRSVHHNTYCNTTEKPIQSASRRSTRRHSDDGGGDDDEDDEEDKPYSRRLVAAQTFSKSLARGGAIL